MDTAGGRLELYDLAIDPGERHEISDAHPRKGSNVNWQNGTSVFVINVHLHSVAEAT